MSGRANWTMDEELLALSYFTDAQLGQIDDKPDLWQECLDEARAVLAHVCDPAFCVPYPCPSRESAR